MTDHKFYEDDEEDELIERLRSEGVSEEKILAALIEEEIIRVDEVTETDAVITDVQEGNLNATEITVSDVKIPSGAVDLSDDRTHADDGEKPEWSHTEHHVLAPYRHNLTVNKGPEVDFVNGLFGVNSDTYGSETVTEVRAWQVRKGLVSTGFLTLAEYSLL